MLIVSKSFRDYYDSASTYGVDRSIQYVRKNEKIRFTFPAERLEFYSTKSHRDGRRFFVQLIVIGFCGDIYPAAVVGSEKYESWKKITDKKIMDVHYSEADTIAWIKPIGGIPNRKRERRSGESVYFIGLSSWGSTHLYNHFVGNYSRDYSKIFVKYRVPVFVLREKGKLELNPRLQDFKFGRIKPAAQAFQDIQQYLDGVIGGKSKPIPTISNADKIIQHGFDTKSSFRKEPKKTKISR